MGNGSHINGFPEQTDVSNRLFLARPPYHFTFPISKLPQKNSLEKPYFFLFFCFLRFHSTERMGCILIFVFLICLWLISEKVLRWLLCKKMTTYHFDPDFVRWGLQLIDVCSLSNDGSQQTLTCYENDCSQTESVTEGFQNPTCSFVENDEIIAHTLQEELSNLATSDASEFTYHSSPGFQYNQEKKEKENFSFESECEGILPEVEDESDIDGILGKWLNQMVSVPHVPKTNGDIPSANEATSDHQRLLNRLQLYELTELKILGDGNCQFRSLSDQIYRTPEHHDFVREQVVNQLKSEPELYDNYVPMAYDDYLKKISKSGEWGDHVTLQAAADCYGIKIFVITSFRDTCYIEILPQNEKSNRIIFLSFWAEVHYNSIYPLGELPAVEGKKNKGWRWT